MPRADWGGRGQTSGIDLRSSLTAIYTVRDGQIGHDFTAAVGNLAEVDST